MKPPISLLIIAVILLCNTVNAQKSAPEFRKGWLLNAKLTNGMVANFHSNFPDIYTGGLALNPQITVVPNVLRLGANVGGVYTNKKVSGMFGPMAALKLANFKAGAFGTLANMHLIAEANWGTDKQAMVGGGLGFEILKLAHVGLTVQRGYKLSNWWLQSFIAIRLNKLKHDADDGDTYSR